MDKLTRAVAEALYWRIAFANSSPDGGMGVSPEELLDRLLVQMCIPASDIDKDAAMAYAKRKG